MPDAERARLMLRELLTRGADALAQIERRNNAKSFRETTSQARNLQSYLEYFVGMADRLPGQQIPENGYRNVGYVALFGGFKQSGYGRDNGLVSTDGYLHTRIVRVEFTGATRDRCVIG